MGGLISADMIYYFCGIAGAVIFFISISYWAVNFFIKQVTERTFEHFRVRIAKEAELALKLFREGLCEQIVLQENKSDSLAKLYATLIDMMQLGKNFTTGLGKGDLELAGRRVKSLRETCDTFTETYQRQSLHFTEEFCALLDAFIVEQKAVIDYVETNWNLTHKDPQENEKRETQLKQSWLKFEDRLTSVMESLRTEFRRRQPAGNIMMNWLKDTPAADSPAPRAKV
jgi:hypothetical protein